MDTLKRKLYIADVQKIVKTYRERMNNAGMNQKELAALAGIGKVTISLIFNGLKKGGHKKTKLPQQKTMDKIEQAFSRLGV